MADTLSLGAGRTDGPPTQPSLPNGGVLRPFLLQITRDRRAPPGVLQACLLLVKAIRVNSATGVHDGLARLRHEAMAAGYDLPLTLAPRSGRSHYR